MGLQEVAGLYKGLHGVILGERGYMGSKRVTQGYKGLHWVTEGYMAL